jgi:hypothetical protein
MYLLETTIGYEQELRRLAEDTPVVESVLERSVYLTLKSSPMCRAARLDGLRCIRVRILHAVLLADVYYRVDEVARVVTLVSIRGIDATMM